MKSACKNRFLATFLLAICFIMGTPLWAQQKVVHGVVEDLEGNPMPGVSVMVEGTTTGTISDMDGKYEIAVPSGKNLIFSFIGMKSEKVEVGGKTGSAEAGDNVNAWFVGFAPYEAPEIAVVVLVENGSHGYYAAEVAKEIIEAQFKLKENVAENNTALPYTEQQN